MGRLVHKPFHLSSPQTFSEHLLIQALGQQLAQQKHIHRQDRFFFLPRVVWICITSFVGHTVITSEISLLQTQRVVSPTWGHLGRVNPYGPVGFMGLVQPAGRRCLSPRRCCSGLGTRHYGSKAEEVACNCPQVLRRKSNLKRFIS